MIDAQELLLAGEGALLDGGDGVWLGQQAGDRDACAGQEGAQGGGT